MPAKKLQGIVVSDKMQNTVVVAVDTYRRHPRYEKVVRQTKRYQAHDTLGVKEGEVVEIVESRPLSKKKRWGVVGVVKR